MAPVKDFQEFRALLGDDVFTKLLNQSTTSNPLTGKRTPKPVATPEPSKTKAEELFQGQNNSKKNKHKKRIRLEQWVEITMENGVVKTELFPSNEVLIREGQAMWPAPEYVYRRLNFVDGIPDIYEWAGVKDENHRKWGGMGIQRMTVNTWLGLIEEEAKRGDGHLNPVTNLGRPRELGECPCDSCQRAYKIEDSGSTVDEYIAQTKAGLL